MMETKAQFRLATTAIIAALAIASTSLLAQDAPPADTSVDALAPAPTTDAAIVPETVAPEVTPTASEAAPAPSTNAKAPRRAATTTTARPSARPAPAPVGTVDTPAPALAAAEPTQALPADAALPPAPPVIVEPAASRQGQRTAILSIAAAVLLGLAALAAFAIHRRRRRAAEVEDAEWQAEEVAVADAEPAMAVEPEPEPVRTEPTFVATTVPAAAAPAAAFAMGAGPAAAFESAVAPTACREAAPGSHVEAACEGPTANNPSLSIKKRLKRAHFFDQREFLAEAGEVAPMATDAGLPEAVEKPEPAPPTRPM